MRDDMRLALVCLCVGFLAGCQWMREEMAVTGATRKPQGVVAQAAVAGGQTSAEASSSSPSASTAPGKLIVKTFALNAFKPELDGQWQCTKLASDGNVYFGSSTHSGHHGGMFLKYNPRSGELTVLSKDITEVCGEDPKANPQGKLHSPLVEANGWLYFATHFSSEGPGARETYTGAHLLGYELATGKFRDFGVVHPGYTVYSAVNVDARRGKIYVFVTPISNEQVAAGGTSALYLVDIATGDKRELIKLRPGNHVAVQWMFVDDHGDCWFTVSGEPGNLYCARGESGKIDRWEKALPLLHGTGKEEVLPDAQQGDRRWRFAEAVPGNKQCVFTMQGGGMLWRFDPARVTDPPTAFEPVKFIGFNGLGMTVAGGRVYYVKSAGTSRGAKARSGEQGLHLMSVSLDPRNEYAIADHGLIVDQDGRQPFRIEGITADEKGHVYMTGDWYVLPGEKGTMRYSAKGGQESYIALDRGQFFAVADVSISLTK
jgi:hypothetical protein